MSILERKDFESVAQSTFKDLANRGARPARGYSIRMTSGTSVDGPLTIVWETKYTAQGLSQGAKCFLLLHGLLTVRLGNVLHMMTIGAEEVRMLVLDNADISPEVCALLLDFLPDHIYSFPSFLTQLAPQLDRRVREQVLALGFGGAGLTQAHYDFFAHWFPNAKMRVVYMSNETGSISDDGCGSLPRNHYHPKPTVTVDIGEVDEDGIGDLYVSTRLTERTTVNNYRIGDVGRWAEKKCACGKEKMFEVLGRRGYDFIKLGSAILRQEECDRVAELCEDLFEDYLLEASVETKGTVILGKVRLLVYRARGAFTKTDIEAIVSRVSTNLFLSYTKTLADFVDTGFLLPLEVVPQEEPFVKGYKNVRLKQIAQ